MISSTVCAVGALRLISMARMPNRMIWMVAPAAYQNGPDTPVLVRHVGALQQRGRPCPARRRTGLMQGPQQGHMGKRETEIICKQINWPDDEGSPVRHNVCGNKPRPDGAPGCVELHTSRCISLVPVHHVKLTQEQWPQARRGGGRRSTHLLTTAARPSKVVVRPHQEGGEYGEKYTCKNCCYQHRAGRGASYTEAVQRYALKQCAGAPKPTTIA